MLHRKTTIGASFESLFGKIVEKKERKGGKKEKKDKNCLLYTSDAADE